MPDKKDKNVTAYTTTGSLVGLAGALLLRKLTAPKKGIGWGDYALWGSVGAGLGGLAGYGLATVDTSKRSPEQRKQIIADLEAKKKDIENQLKDPDRKPGWLRAFWAPGAGLGIGGYLEAMRLKLWGSNISKDIKDLGIEMAKLQGSRGARLNKLIADSGNQSLAEKIVAVVDAGEYLDPKAYANFAKSVDKINDLTTDILSKQNALDRLKSKRARGRGWSTILPAIGTAVGTYVNWDEISDWWNTKNNPKGIAPNYRSTSELNEELKKLTEELSVSQGSGN